MVRVDLQCSAQELLTVELRQDPLYKYLGLGGKIEILVKLLQIRLIGLQQLLVKFVLWVSAFRWSRLHSTGDQDPI